MFHADTTPGRNNPSSFGGRDTSDNHATRKGWSEQIIYDNLKTERPSWPFTSFGAPFFRPLVQADLSFEEYHLAAMEANRTGNFSNWQRECDQRIAKIKQQEENILRNIRQAWQYNVNEPYYPSGKMEGGASGAFGGGATTQNAFGGGGGTLSAFGTPPNQSAFGGDTPAFGQAASASFGSSPFGAMPASAFTLGSRDSGTSTAFGQTPSAFGNITSTPAFGATSTTTSAPSAFGQTFSTPLSTFSQQTTTSAFGSKPSILGTSSLPSAPSMSSTLTPSQPTFGQPSILGATTLPPPPGTGFAASKPTFGQPSGLGAMSTSTPAFGQASSFSSPFAGGLGRALSGATTGTSSGSTFGSRSSFGSFAQTNQPNAFAQAAGLGGQNAFMQGPPSGGGFMSSQQQQQGTGVGAFGAGGNRFQLLSEVAADAATGDKDDDMADEPSPAVGKAPGFTTMQESNTAPPTPLTSVPPPPAEPVTATPAPPSQSPPASQPPLAFGAQQQTSLLQTESPKTVRPPTQQALQSVPPSSAQATPARSSPSRKDSAIDDMAAWMADRFTIGQVPETEPPPQVC